MALDTAMSAVMVPTNAKVIKSAIALRFKGPFANCFAALYLCTPNVKETPL